MNYLLSKQHCFIKSEKIVEIFPFVKYEIDIKDENILIFGNFNPQVVNFYTCENVEKLEDGVDNYYFLDFKSSKVIEVANINFKGKTININSGTDLRIVFDGKKIFEQTNLFVSYSHFEVFCGYCMIYFYGERNFFVCLKEEIVFASYYDEINIKEKDRYFMRKTLDCLNQGEVFHISDTAESYYVYLDDYELKMKDKFCACVFLDCIMTNNLKYANKLLCDDLSKKDEKQIKFFFGEFDEFFILKENEYVLKNKNALVGIFKFHVDNCKIQNIIQL